MHNFKACTYISKKEDFCDWTITIAFYAAIHYVRHLMLPLSDFGATYTTFESLFRAKKIDGEGRHGYQLRFVREHFPKIAHKYAWLHDMSNNARYINYKYTRDNANLAKKYLDEIKQLADKKEG